MICIYLLNTHLLSHHYVFMNQCFLNFLHGPDIVLGIENRTGNGEVKVPLIMFY